LEGWSWRGWSWRWRDLTWRRSSGEALIALKLFGDVDGGMEASGKSHGGHLCIDGICLVVGRDCSSRMVDTEAPN
jgi:hypothetical protein